MTIGIINDNKTVLTSLSETEILDVAPIDLLHTINKEVVKDIPLPEAMKGHAIDIVFHWVNEKGNDARLTSGATVKCTVGQYSPSSKLRYLIT